MAHQLPPLSNFTHNKYRPDIDGLRALAVMGVVIYHIFPSRLPSGYFGVDVFFVISGYLISGIIMSSLSSGKFSFYDFWARRIRRIFPSLLTVLIAALGIGYFFLLPSEFNVLKGHLKWGLGFAANFKLNSEVNYFDTEANTKPLLHLWSLAIEEQFYILWPGCLWFCFKKNFDLFKVTLGLAVLSFASGFAFPHTPSQLFYMPWVRFWELHLGALLSFWTFENGGLRNRIPLHRNIISLVGLLLILIAFFIFSETPLPRWFAVVPTLGAAFLIISGPTAWLNKWFLSNKIVVFLGLISYPLYLWHWPIYSYLTIILTLTKFIRVLIVVSSIILSVGTYYFIENTFRFESPNSRWRAPSLLIVLVFFLLGLNIFEIKPRSAQINSDISNVEKSMEWDYPTPKMIPHTFPDGVKYFKIQTNTPRITLFVGDSHMEHYGPRIDAISNTNPNNVMSSLWLTAGGCLFIEGYYPDCLNGYNHLIELIENRESLKIDRIVWSSFWEAHIESGSGLQKDASGRALLGQSKTSARLQNIKRLLEKMVGSGAEVFVLLTNPFGPEFNPVTMFERHFNGLTLMPPVVKRELVNSRIGKSNLFVESTALELGINVINPTMYLCSEFSCSTRDSNNLPHYKDADHFSPKFAREHLEFIDKTVLSRTHLITSKPQ